MTVRPPRIVGLIASGIFAAAIVTAASGKTMPAAPSATTTLMPFYTASLVRRLTTGGVPVLLPLRLPPVFGSISTVSVIAADRTGYAVAYSSVAGCHGALSCATLHVAGRRTSEPDLLAGRERSIRLPDGLRGRYRSRDCSGASCTESSLTFVRGQTVYEIDAKADLDDLPAILDVYRALRRLTVSRRVPGGEQAVAAPSSHPMSTRRQRPAFGR